MVWEPTWHGKVLRFIHSASLKYFQGNSRGSAPGGGNSEAQKDSILWGLTADCG